jgi:hypothetical protein
MKEGSFENRDQSSLKMEAGKTRRSFLGTTLPTLIMAGAGLSLLDHEHKQKELAAKNHEAELLAKIKTTAEVPHYFTPIVHAHEDAATVGKMTDGVARIDDEGVPIKLEEAAHFRESISWRVLHEKPEFDFTFRDKVDRVRTGITPFESVKYDKEGVPHEVGSIKAMYAYSSRFSPLCDAVERRYNLPHGLLVAMMMQESTGIEFLPNMKDGGFGLIHMQNSTAHEFGLNVSGDPKKTKDPANAAELLAVMRKTDEDPVTLSEMDERLNALANIDAAGRMLSSWMSDPEVIARATQTGHLRRAIYRYCGPNNWPQYWDRICRYMALINDPAYEKRIAAEFNEINKAKLMPDGTKATFDRWLGAHQNYYETNYAIDEYRKLTLLKPKYSDMVQKTYQEIMRETEEKNALERMVQAKAKDIKKKV